MPAQSEYSTQQKPGKREQAIVTLSCAGRSECETFRPVNADGVSLVSQVDGLAVGGKVKGGESPGRARVELQAAARRPAEDRRK